MVWEDDVLAGADSAQAFCGNIGTNNSDEDSHTRMRSMDLRCLKRFTVNAGKRLLQEVLSYVILNQNAGRESFFSDFS